MSVLLYLVEYACIVGRTLSIAYSSNIFELRGGRLFTNAAPSVMMVLVYGSASGVVTWLSRMVMRWDPRGWYLSKEVKPILLDWCIESPSSVGQCSAGLRRPHCPCRTVLRTPYGSSLKTQTLSSKPPLYCHTSVSA